MWIFAVRASDTGRSADVGTLIVLWLLVLAGAVMLTAALKTMM